MLVVELKGIPASVKLNASTRGEYYALCNFLYSHKSSDEIGGEAYALNIHANQTLQHTDGDYKKISLPGNSCMTSYVPYLKYVMVSINRLGASDGTETASYLIRQIKIKIPERWFSSDFSYFSP
jgi:hypothetical protein